MAVLIDSSVLIDAERGRLDLGTRIRGREDEKFFVSVVTASEILHGVWRARDLGVRARRSDFVEGILAEFPILTIDLATAREHAQLWADLQSQGMMIGPHDCWLAATCLAHNLAMATSNVREFRRVRGLVVEDWSASPDPPSGSHQ